MKNRNIYFDAYCLFRAGQHSGASEMLQINYAKASQREISKAIVIGKELNEKLWNLAEEFRDKLVSKEEATRQIKEICPTLSAEQISKMMSNSRFDTR